MKRDMYDEQWVCQTPCKYDEEYKGTEWHKCVFVEDDDDVVHYRCVLGQPISIGLVRVK